METVRFLLTGDASLSVEFGSVIDPAINARIRAFSLALGRSGIPGIVETVPSYRALMIHYDPERILHGALVERLQQLLTTLDGMEVPPGSVLELPVCYGGEFGPDLDFVAQHTGKTAREVIRLHSGRDYLIYMLGFTPGFPYLGGMDPAIAAPRLDTPRVVIPGGSVGIAGEQTGVYPMDSPGGWRLIGRTPVKLYDPRRETPILPAAGDFIRFRPIGEDEYRDIAADVERGTYACVRRAGKEER